MRHQHFAIAPDPGHGGTQIGKQFGELRQRRVDYRTIFVAVDRHHRDPVLRKKHHVASARQRDPSKDHIADFHFGGNDDVDGQVVSGKKVLPMRLAIALRTDARDLGRDIEQGVSHLAGNHVHFVIQGDRNDHVGLFGAGTRQHIGMGAMADMAANVKLVLDVLDKVG